MRTKLQQDEHNDATLMRCMALWSHENQTRHVSAHPIVTACCGLPASEYLRIGREVLQERNK